jgi:hypothetical protein
MPVTRYQRKPDPRPEGGLHVARYEPGHLDDMLAVAQMADHRAEVGEAELPGGTVLVVKWVNYESDHPEPEFDVVRTGNYLSYSETYGSLGETDDADLRQFYDLDAKP